nr:hypothetical protein [uncultured Enterobacter sp.]
MATNDFKPFATGASANVTSQTDWSALPALLSGFQSGKASSAQVNKALRQATFVAAALAQFVSDKSGQNVLDDGNLAGFVSKLTAGFANQYLSRSNPFGDIKTDGAAAISTALANLGLGGTTNYVDLGNGYRLVWVKGNAPGGVLAAAAAVAVSLTFPQAFGSTPIIYWSAVSTPSGVAAGAGVVATCADLTATGMSVNLYNASNANKQITAVIGFAIGKM